jgi:hypothetical protein
MGNHGEWSLEGHWIWLLALLLGLTLPLLIWRGKRLAYLACATFLLAIATAALWYVDRNGCKYTSPSWYTPTPNGNFIWHIRFGSQCSAVGVGVQHLVVHEEDLRADENRLPNPYLAWSVYTFRPKDTRFPLQVEPFPPAPCKLQFHWGDFQVFIAGAPDNGRTQTTLTSWAFSVPDWFAILVLLTPAGLWLARRPHRIRQYRRTHNLCQHCGYNLTGTPCAADATRRCSECGTVNPSATTPASASEKPVQSTPNPPPTTNPSDTVPTAAQEKQA